MGRRVMDQEPLPNFDNHFGSEHIGQRLLAVDVEIVHDQVNLVGRRVSTDYTTPCPKKTLSMSLIARTWQRLRTNWFRWQTSVTEGTILPSSLPALEVSSGSGCTAARPYKIYQKPSERMSVHEAYTNRSESAPEIYERLVRESARRKIAWEPNQLLSALLREAVTKYRDVLT